MSWERNGGFLLGSDIQINGKLLKALPSRDAVIAILAALISATEQKTTVSKLFEGFPFAASGLLDQFPASVTQEIMQRLKPSDPNAEQIEFTPQGIWVRYANGDMVELDASQPLAKEMEAKRALVSKFFTAQQGFSPVSMLQFTDGMRIFFENGDLAHVRQSGNSPQLRIYAEAANQERADAIVAMGLARPNEGGILRRMEADVTAVGHPFRAAAGYLVGALIYGINVCNSLA